MPRNRQDIDREQKIAEILDAADRQVRANGYDGLSFTGIASEVKLARGAVYWYFTDKDELLIALAIRTFSAGLGDPPRRAQYMSRLLWAVERLVELEPITAALHERARHSDQAAELEATIQEEMCERLRVLLHGLVAPERLEAVATAIVTFVNGLLSLQLTRAERERRLRFLAGELIT